MVSACASALEAKMGANDDSPEMKRKRRIIEAEVLLPGESGIRSMMSSAAGKQHLFFRDLDDARRHSDSAVIFEGDYGGTIYLTTPVRLVACNEQSLAQLLRNIDAIAWRDTSGTGLFYELLPVGSPVAGGMGGGTVVDGLWLHPKIEAVGVRSEIDEVLAGTKSTITVGGRHWR
jgi:hypothetical protein